MKVTKVEKTITFLNSIARGTTFTREDYINLEREYYKKTKEHLDLVSYDTILANPLRFNAEKIVDYYTTVSSKITTVDVLQMIKQGYSVEEIEKAVYTKVKTVSIKLV